MSHSRHRSQSAQGQASGGALPPITAIFVVKFDRREGYKLVWSRSASDIQLEGIVDFKSLPSGLHNVKEDLVFFIHDEYAGISAFVNVPGNESQRNAQMLAVGALLPLSYGRLGKSWLHAEGLQELAKEHVSNSNRLRMLEEYWEKNKVPEEHVADGGSGRTPGWKPRPGSSPQRNGYRRPRAISDATALMTSDPQLSPNHPAISLPKLIGEFGPLIFPLYRAALLRKRILMVGDPPVKQNCDFVYNLSILSSIPPSLLSLLPIDIIPPLRLRALFNVGVQDIPALELPTKQQSDATTQTSSSFPPSWVACTTDDVLATKPQLYDILVILPPSSSSSLMIKPTTSTQSKSQRHPHYPNVYPSSPLLSRALPKHNIKATQRDLRRYLSLRAGLRNLPSAKPPGPKTSPEAGDRTAPRSEDGDNEDGKSLTSSSTISSTFSRTSVVESMPWALIAYTTFIWWASAGEKKSGLGEDEEEQGEDEQDHALLLNDDGDEIGEGADEGIYDVSTKEIAIVRYFHRLTGLIFATVSDAISRVDGESVRREDDGGNGCNNRDARDEEGAEGLGIRLADPPNIINGDQEEEGEAEEEEEEEAAENEPLLPHPSQEPKDNREANGSESESQSFSQAHPQPIVEITSQDMSQMGLDVWSSADRSFVEEFVQLWWGREVVVQGGNVKCCGVRVL